MTFQFNRVSQFCDGRDNNFNLLRFGAAGSVILAHSILLSGNLDSPLAWSLGYFAVNCFFVISGFLVCRSLLLRNNLRDYGVSRVLRVYPALILCVLICVLFVGLWQTTFSTADFLSHPQTLRFWLHNSLLISGESSPYLPMVFDQNPVPGQVNAPLWTLQYEIAAYALLAMLFALSRFSGGRQQRVFCFLVCLLGGFSMVAYLLNVASASPSVGLEANLVRFGAMFFSGAVIYLFRRWIPLSSWICFVALCLVVVSSPIRPLFISLTYFSLGYLLIYLAFVPGGMLRKFNRLGDYSYGLYIYAFPVQQLLVAYAPGISATELFFSAMMLTLPLAILSWHLLEKPMLDRKPLQSRPSMETYRFNQSIP